MKKTVVVLASGIAIAAVIFTGCAKKDSAEQKKLVFEYLTLSFQVEWAQQMEAALKEQAVIHNFELKSSDPSFNIETQLSQIDAAIVQKVDGAFLWVVDEAQAPAAVSKLNDAKIPVFGESFPLRDSSGNAIAPYVQLDDWAVGTTSGNWVVDNWRSTGVDLSNITTVGVIDNNSSQYSANVTRSNGFIDAMKKGFPNLEDIYRADIAAETATTDTTEAAYKQVSAVFAAHPEKTAWVVFGCTDNYAQGAVRAIEAAGLEKVTILVSAGGELAFKEWSNNAAPSWRAACYFHAKHYVKYMVEGMLDICRNGKKAEDLFPEYKEKGQNYAEIKVSGRMVTRDTYKDVL